MPRLWANNPVASSAPEARRHTTIAEDGDNNHQVVPTRAAGLSLYSSHYKELQRSIKSNYEYQVMVVILKVKVLSVN
jgi:hypothetical protein